MQLPDDHPHRTRAYRYTIAIKIILVLLVLFLLGKSDVAKEKGFVVLCMISVGKLKKFRHFPRLVLFNWNHGSSCVLSSL